MTKTRLVLQYSADRNGKQYKGMFDALVKIYRHEGVSGLYKVRHECVSVPYNVRLHKIAWLASLNIWEEWLKLGDFSTPVNARMF